MIRINHCRHIKVVFSKLRDLCSNRTKQPSSNKTMQSSSQNPNSARKEKAKVQNQHIENGNAAVW